jgi:uncharacterized protein (TIGR02452 family)
VRESIHYRPTDWADVFTRRDRQLQQMPSESQTMYRVSNTTTLSAARELVTEEARTDVAILNFASAKHPGGGFFKGSGAQEESLSRASGLYPCIAQMRNYYNTHRRPGSSCFYTDRMIYSPGVPVFRDDADRLLAEPYQVAVLTAPAVNAGAVRQNEPERVSEIETAMFQRMEKVLSLAVVHGHRVLVLGAWGCGVFKNDPKAVAAWFDRCLRGTFRNAFDVVVFAVLDTTNELGVLTPFAEHFGGKAEA